MINLLDKTIMILEVLDAWYFSYSAQEHLGLFGILGGQFEKKMGPHSTEMLSENVDHTYFCLATISA